MSDVYFNLLLLTFTSHPHLTLQNIYINTTSINALTGLYLIPRKHCERIYWKRSKQLFRANIQCGVSGDEELELGRFANKPISHLIAHSYILFQCGEKVGGCVYVWGLFVFALLKRNATWLLVVCRGKVEEKKTWIQIRRHLASFHLLFAPKVHATLGRVSWIYARRVVWCSRSMCVFVQRISFTTLKPNFALFSLSFSWYEFLRRMMAKSRSTLYFCHKHSSSDIKSVAAWCVLHYRITCCAVYWRKHIVQRPWWWKSVAHAKFVRSFGSVM